MAKIITLESYNTVQFYQIPQAFYHNPKYIGMNPSSREAYAMLRNLLPLSIKNGWINEEGEIYVKFSREKLMLRLGIGKDKMVKVFKELRDRGLIIEKRIGCNKCNEIYLCEAEDLNEIYSDEELLNLLEEDENEGIEPQLLRSSVKQKFEPLKKRGQDCVKTEVKTSEKQRHNKNKINKTEVKETKIKQQQLKEVVVVDFVDNSSAHEEIINKELIDIYKENMDKKPTKAIQRQIAFWLKRMERECIEEALMITGSNGKDFNYTVGILKRWHEFGVRDMGDVFYYDRAQGRI